MATDVILHECVFLGEAGLNLMKVGRRGRNTGHRAFVAIIQNGVLHLYAILIHYTAHILTFLGRLRYMVTAEDQMDAEQIFFSMVAAPGLCQDIPHTSHGGGRQPNLSRVPVQKWICLSKRRGCLVRHDIACG